MEATDPLDRIGVWSSELRTGNDPELLDAVVELDAIGLRTIWIPGLGGSGVFESVGRLLRAAPHITVAVGVLGIWGQVPGAVGDWLRQLDAEFGPRTLLGLGVSTPERAAAVGGEFGNSIDTMAGYLSELDALPDPLPADRRFLGAFGPRMVGLAGARSAGVHPFLMPVDYTADTRRRIGAGPLVAPHQAVVFESDPDRARSVARDEVGRYIGQPAFRRRFRRLGYTDADLVVGGSDRLIDDVVAWGDADRIRDRITAHWDAGADHVAIHVLGTASRELAGQWRTLADMDADDRSRRPTPATTANSADVTTLQLTTTGRRTGARRTHEVIYRMDGDRYVVGASDGGARRHPAWFLNLVAEPQVRVSVSGEEFAGWARVADYDERARLWQLMRRLWPSVDDYQAKAGRVIPLVVIERT